MAIAISMLALTVEAQVLRGSGSEALQAPRTSRLEDVPEPAGTPPSAFAPGDVHRLAR